MNQLTGEITIKFLTLLPLYYARPIIAPRYSRVHLLTGAVALESKNTRAKVLV